MKKTILFLGLIAASIGGSLHAQDTIHLAGPQSNYFYNVWLDSGSFNRWADRNGYMNPGDAVAKLFLTNDTLNVYGVAGILLNPWDDFCGDTAEIVSQYLDTSRSNCSSSFRIYQYDASQTDPMVALGEPLPVVATAPVSYFLDMGAAMPNELSGMYNSQFPIFPVFERYFQTPQTVHDTFYTGINFEMNWGACNYGQAGYLPTLPFYIPLFIPNEPKVWNESIAGHYFDRNPMTAEIDTMWIYTENLSGYMFIFPIIAPPDTTVNPGDTIVDPIDTILSGDLIIRSGNTVVIAPGDIIVIGGDTIVNTGDTLTVTLGDTVVISGHPVVINPGDTLTVNPGDTLFVNSDGSITVNPGGTIVVSSSGGGTPGIGIQTNDLLYRYTSVQPNPATDKVRVTSSFGLTRIEAYDLRGRLLFETPASGLKADLDVSSWPRGTYLLRISTPAGTTTKKLLIR